jgi:hypothetical protein
MNIRICRIARIGPCVMRPSRAQGAAQPAAQQSAVGDSRQPSHLAGPSPKVARTGITLSKHGTERERAHCRRSARTAGAGGCHRCGCRSGDLRAPAVTAARRPVVPLHGTRGFRDGLEGLIMPDACRRNQAERLGWCPCGEGQHLLQDGWLPGFTIRWSELSPARGLATCGVGARSARSAADAGGQLAGRPSVVQETVASEAAGLNTRHRPGPADAPAGLARPENAPRAAC